ncbi:MAG: hypothetical protein EBX50_13560, partial [Chitinophagia bacterium]|nr:hypothetical protein [Chitinophagia bacterium]
MPPSRNNTVKFTDLQAISSVNAGDIIPVVDTSIPTSVNKKINVQDFSRSLPVSQQVAQIRAMSANWNSSYSTTLANSASWSTGGSYGSVYSANSAEYESTYTNVNINSANWNSAYNTVQTSSAAWVGLTTFTTVNSLSNNWNTGYNLANSAYTSLSTLSSGYWLLKTGDQLTGALTTTRTVTANFTLDELVSKRYVDAMAAATQISGNFVPSLYYTKADFSTGVPLVCATTLQTNAFALGTAGGSQTGVLYFNPNQYGTSVTGFTLDSTNNRTGLRIICGSYNRFNASEQGLSYVWGGPTFQQNIFTLGDSSGNNVMAVDHYSQYHAAPLTNSVVLRCTTPVNFFIRNYSNIFLDVPTVSGRSFIADQYTVQNDGFYRGIGGHYLQMATNNFFFVGNNIRTLSIAENITPGNGGIWMRSDRIVGWSTGGDPGNTGDLRLKRIGASSLALDSGGTANVPSFTVFGDISASRDMFSTSLQSSSNLLLSAVGNITLNAGGSLSFSQSLPTSFAGLQATAPGSPSNSYFKVLSSNNLTLFNINSAGRIAIRGRSSLVTEDQMNFPSRELELVGFTQPILFRHNASNTGFIVDEFSHGLYSDSGGCYIGSGGSSTRVYVVGGGINLGFSNTGMMAVNGIGKVRIGRGIIDSSTSTTLPAPSAHVQIITDSSYNSHVTDILVLSAGPNVSISNYINCVSAGQTIFSVNSTGQFNTANFSADFINLNQVGGSASYNTGVLRIPNDVTGQLRPGLWSYGSTTGTPQPPPTSINGDISLATFGGGSHFNRAFIFSNAILTSRITTSPNIPSPGSGNFDEGIADLSLKVAGRIGFTDTSLGTSNFVRTVSATMGYDWSTNLIALSSRTNRSGFIFESKSGENQRSAIYHDSSDFLNISVGSGAGKFLLFRSMATNTDPAGGILGTLSFTGWQIINTSITNFTGYTTSDSLRITQITNQTAPYFRAVNSVGSTIFQINSAN